MEDRDVDAVVGVWHRSGLAAYTYIETWQRFTLDEAGRVFREHISPRCAIWVAEVGGEIVGYLAMDGNYVDRLYVTPEHQGRGIGSALLEQAHDSSPDALELHTHQRNVDARTFYEKRGFVAVEFGISPPPENEPDVRYRWQREP